MGDFDDGNETKMKLLLSECDMRQVEKSVNSQSRADKLFP